jgi:hypothetical protein
MPHNLDVLLPGSASFSEELSMAETVWVTQDSQS